MILVDASVALKWFLAEPDRPLAVRLSREHELAAPDLIIAEIANGLWKAVRKGALAGDQAQMAMATLRSRFDALMPLDRLCERAFEIARGLGHPVYDCFYLACAEQERWALVTADQRFLKTVGGTEWEPICRPLS